MRGSPCAISSGLASPIHPLMRVPVPSPDAEGTGRPRSGPRVFGPAVWFASSRGDTGMAEHGLGEGGVLGLDPAPGRSKSDRGEHPTLWCDETHMPRNHRGAALSGHGDGIRVFKHVLPMPSSHHQQQPATNPFDGGGGDAPESTCARSRIHLPTSLPTRLKVTTTTACLLRDARASAWARRILLETDAWSATPGYSTRPEREQTHL